MLANNDEISFLNEEREDVAKERPQKPPWKILIVDDEPEVHFVTEMALASVEFMDRSLSFISAHSSAEAITKIEENPDTALILLDVVMETNDAGFEVVKHVREKIRNERVRIVLRTGQPGHAPEKEVIERLDINDYKSKDELTRLKLYSCVITSLRSYAIIETVEEQGEGLEKILNAATTLFELNNLDKFNSEVLQQLSSLLIDLEGEGTSLSSSFIARETSGKLLLQAGRGIYEKEKDSDLSRVMETETLEHLLNVSRNTGNCFLEKTFVAKLPGIPDVIIVLFFEYPVAISNWKKKLIDVYLSKVAVAYKNIRLYEVNQKTQEAAILSLARLAEYKDNETGDHIKRVEIMTIAVAERLYAKGKYPEIVNEDFVRYIGTASILHDVGKVGISDRILLKNAALTDEEFELVKQHTIIGGAILCDAANMISGVNYLSMASEIAEYHHEKFSGGGYPASLEGEEIPLCARIVAAVDVFDALTSKRPYKEPWPLEKAVALIKSESGKHFDPVIVEVLLELIEDGSISNAP